jgi:hypothetical protein
VERWALPRQGFRDRKRGDTATNMAKYGGMVLKYLTLCTALEYVLMFRSPLRPWPYGAGNGHGKSSSRDRTSV